MSDRSREATGSLLCLLALTAMVAVMFVPLLLTHRVPLLMDLCYLFYPAYVFFRESVLSGTLPLWNPYMGCGEPFLADVQRGVLYPPNLVFLLPTSRAIVVSTAFHVLLAGIGAYAMGRAWKVSRIGSLLAGVSYAFNSYTITKVEFPSQLAATAWFPVVLAAYIRWLDRRDRRTLFLMAGALCLQFLAGHPVVMTFAVWTLGIYAVLMGFVEWRTRRKLRAFPVPALGLAGAGVLGFLLAMAQFYPTWEALQVSPRAEALKPSMDFASVHPLALFTLLIPSVYGSGGWRGLSWAPSCHSLNIGAFYVGIVPMVVLLAAAIHRIVGGPARPSGQGEGVLRFRVPFLVVVFVFFFLFSTGKYTPVFGLCWRAIPLLQRFRWPAECLLCVTLALSALAGIGLDAIGRHADRLRAAAGFWRGFLLRYGPLMGMLAASLLVGACLVDGGRLGVFVLRSFFNFEPYYEHCPRDVPWSLLRQDCVKFIIGGLFAAALLTTYAFRPKARTAAGGALILVAFVDLFMTNFYLLQVGPADILDKPSPYAEMLGPQGKMVRFFAFEHAMPDEVWKDIDELVKGCPIEEIRFDTTEVHRSGDVFGRLVRPLRELLYSSWPTVEKAFNACSFNNFVSRNARRMVFTSTWPGPPVRGKKRLLSMMGCDRIVMVPNLKWAFACGSLDSARLAHLEHPMPRAFVVGGIQVLPEENDVLLNMVYHPSFDPWEVAVTDKESARGDDFTDLRARKINHAIRRFDYTPNHLRIEVEAEKPGVLVVGDAFYPGWTAGIDGKEVPIYKVNYAFRGVRIPQGTSVVEMSYSPRSLPVGLAVSLTTLLSMIILAKTGTRKTRRSNPEHSTP